MNGTILCGSRAILFSNRVTPALEEELAMSHRYAPPSLASLRKELGASLLRCQGGFQRPLQAVCRPQITQVLLSRSLQIIFRGPTPQKCLTRAVAGRGICL